jgi:hypothetical protein
MIHSKNLLLSEILLHKTTFVEAVMSWDLVIIYVKYRQREKRGYLQEGNHSPTRRLRCALSILHLLFTRQMQL